MPSSHVSLPSNPKTSSTITQTQKYKIFGKKSVELILVGIRRKDAPKTIVKLHTIEPIAVLMPTSSTPLKLETNETVVSGNVVAILTIVAPTIIGGIFAFPASFTDEPTSISPPFNISTKPNTKTNTQIKFVIIKDMNY